MKTMISSISAIALVVFALPVAAYEQEANANIGVSLDASVSTTMIEPDMPVGSGVSGGGTSGSVGATVTAGAGTSIEPMPPTAVAGDADLSVYAAAAKRSDDRIENITFGKDSVAVVFVERGRLFGFIPVTMTVRTEVAGDGLVTVSYPWYRFLVASDATTDVEAALETRVDAWQTTHASTELSAATKAELLDEIRAAVSATAEVGVSP